MGYCDEGCEYLTRRHNCNKYHKGLTYFSYDSKSLAYSSHERCSECDKDHIITDLEAQLNQSWIPVSERLPETQGYYLVTTLRSPRIEMAWYLSGDWFWNNSDTKMGEVITWMPLPEPYIPETTPDLPAPAAEHYMHRFTEVR